MSLSKTDLVVWLQDHCSKREIVAVVANLRQHGCDKLVAAGFKDDLLEQLHDGGPAAKRTLAAMKEELDGTEASIERDLEEDEYEDEGSDEEESEPDTGKLHD